MKDLEGKIKITVRMKEKKKNFVKTVLTEIRKRANNNFSSADLSIYCVHYKNFKDFKYIFFK